MDDDSNGWWADTGASCRSNPYQAMCYGVDQDSGMDIETVVFLMSFLPGLELYDDVSTAMVGCGLSCQAGYEEPVGLGWRVVSAAFIFVPLKGSLLRKFQDHHIIPKILDNHNLVRLARDAGWNIDNYLIRLPENVMDAFEFEIPWHKGSHMGYTSWVERQLDYLYTLAMKEQWTPHDAAIQIEKLVNLIVEQIQELGPSRLR